jgi:hypothetical protein
LLFILQIYGKYLTVICLVIFFNYLCTILILKNKKTMKKSILNSVLVVAVAVCMTSCYSLSYSVGKGAQTGVEVKGKNHYLIEGLIPVGGTTPAELAENAANYDVKIVHSFVDGLLRAITGGIYSPTTVIVKK